jgi:hypothetical protein
MRLPRSPHPGRERIEPQVVGHHYAFSPEARTPDEDVNSVALQTHLLEVLGADDAVLSTRNAGEGASRELVALGDCG